MTEKEIKQMQAEIERLKAENERLHSEMIRLVSRNLDLSERLEADVELRRRTEVARTLMEENPRPAARREALSPEPRLRQPPAGRTPRHQSGAPRTALPQQVHLPHARGLHRQPAHDERHATAAHPAQLQHCCHCRVFRIQPCAHLAAPHDGCHRHDACRLQSSLHKGYVIATPSIKSYLFSMKSFSQRLTQRIVIALTLVLIIIIVGTTYLALRFTGPLTKAYFEHLADIENESVEKRLHDVQVAVHNSIDEVVEDMAHPDSAEAQSTRCLRLWRRLRARLLSRERSLV